MTINRRALLKGVGSLSLTSPCVALAASDAPCKLDDDTQRRLVDWPELGRYAQHNTELITAGEPVDIVFMGDSITQGWPDKRPVFFKRGRVGRGIGGQTTPQMVLRMIAEVIDLKPRLVHIMAGTNDIAGNTGPMTFEMSCNNIRMMTTLAQASGIKVLLASIPPAANFPWRPGLDTVTPIRKLNAWIKRYAAETGAFWVDYHPALATADGAMRAGFAYDGVHPTAAGYDAMAGVLEPILQQLLSGKRS